MTDPYRPCAVNMKDGWICTRGDHADGPCALVPTPHAGLSPLSPIPVPADHFCMRDDVTVDRRAYHSLVRRWNAIVELCRDRQETPDDLTVPLTPSHRLADVDTIWPSEIMEIIMRGIDE